MPGQVEVRYQHLGECLIVRVAGDVDSGGAQTLRDSLVAKVSAGEARLVVDLSRVGGLDVAGISALLAAQQEAEASGGSLRVVGIGPSVRTVLETTDKADALMVDDDLSDALEATMEAAKVARISRLPRQSTAADLTAASRDRRQR
jgi:anti-anti-sigma factor